MFTVKLYIQAFQGAKKHFVDSVMPEGELKQAAHNYVDRQTEFAYMLVDNTTTVLREFWKLTSKNS